MKKIEFTSENYDFKKAMQQHVREDIQPLLYANNFTKYGTNKYVRETDKLVQIIMFRIEKDRLKAFASYVPVFLPFDNILNYGIEVTGSDGFELLNGKYFTTIYEDEKFDKHIQLQHYREHHLDNFNKLILSIKEGIIPEMDIINSLDYFSRMFENKNVIFFGHKFVNQLRNNSVHKFIISVNDCLNGNFEQAKSELENLKSYSSDEEIEDYIERLLLPKGGEKYIKRESFLENFNAICNERRRKYKLLK